MKTNPYTCYFLLIIFCGHTAFFFCMHTTFPDIAQGKNVHGKSYNVQTGDTLYGIACRAYRGACHLWPMIWEQNAVELGKPLCMSSTGNVVKYIPTESRCNGTSILSLKAIDVLYIPEYTPPEIATKVQTEETPIDPTGWPASKVNEWGIVVYDFSVGDRITVLLTSNSPREEESDSRPWEGADGGVVDAFTLSTNCLPLGTKVRIVRRYSIGHWPREFNPLREYTVRDCMSPRFLCSGNAPNGYLFRSDVFNPITELALEHGSPIVELEITHIDPPETRRDDCQTRRWKRDNGMEREIR